MSEKIHILLPVHNRCETTRRFINCLKVQTHQDFQLILIDDGSTDGTDEIVRNEIKSNTVLKGHGDWWWAGSLQQGYNWLKTQKPPSNDVILIINDDTVFGPHFLENAMTVLRNKPKTFLLATCYSQHTGELVDAGIYADWKKFSFEKPSTGRPVNCLSTRGLFFRVADFFIVGGFHPRLLPHYLSDYEFTIRARRKGIDLTTDPSVKIWFDPATTGNHRIENKTVSGAIRTVFSRKSAINPLAMAIFVAFACPWPWKFNCWLRIISRSLSHAWELLISLDRHRHAG